MASLNSKFRTVLTQISDRLDSEDVKSLIFLIKNDVPVQRLENARSGEDVFDVMINHGLLSETKTEKLMDFLTGKNLQPCVTFLSCFTMENAEELKVPEEGPCNIQREMVVEHFQETAKLAELTQKMDEENFVTLTGILGSGKSQLALKFGCMFHENYRGGLCWRIACQDETTLLNSLKKLANSIGLDKDSSKQLENVPNNDSCDSLRNLIQNQLEKFSGDRNLIILDDVMQETRSFCKKFKNGLVEKNVKVLITTWDPSFCEEHSRIQISGFSAEEAVQFLKHKKEMRSEAESKSYYDLAEKLGYHPLLLYSALTCMIDTHSTPKKFIKYLKGMHTRSPHDLDKLIRSSDEVGDKKELFKYILKYLDILKIDEGEEVFDMVMALQFLALEDIPVLLFDFFPMNNGVKNTGVHTINFIQAIQKFSFGFLRGEDDERFISTHLAVVMAIRMITSDEDKIRLLRKILTALVWLMDKDNSDTKDYIRNSNLLPHAIKVLEHVKAVRKEVTSFREDFELQILLAYVYDIVGYTYNFFGILRNAGEHSTEAKETCFYMLGIKEKEIEAMIEQETPHDDHHKSWKDFAEKEADVIFKKMKAVVNCPEKLKVLCTVAKGMLLNKYRGQDHIKLLQDLLGHDLEEEYILTEDEYQKLCEKHLAMPEDKLGPALFYELIIQVFYTFGRRVFYLGDAYDKEIARTFSHYLFLAHSVAERVAGEFLDWKILYVMLTKLSGILELAFEDKADIQLKTIENLENAVSEFKELLKDKSENLIYGIIKSISVTADQHQHICLKRIVRCFTAMMALVDDESKRKEIEEEVKDYQKRLEETKTNCRHATSANLRLAQLFLHINDYDSAISKFKAVCPEDVIEFDEDLKNSQFSHNELQALKGVIECYVKKGDMEQAETLAKRTRMRLLSADETKELAEFINFTSKLGMHSNDVDTLETIYDRKSMSEQRT